MVDPITIVAGVGSVIASILTVLTKVVPVVISYRSASANIRALIGSLETLRGVLKDYDRMQRADTEHLQRIRQPLLDCEDAVKTLDEELQSAIAEFERRSKPGKWNKTKWAAWGENAALVHEQKIGNRKTTLIAAFGQGHYEQTAQGFSNMQQNFDAGRAQIDQGFQAVLASLPSPPKQDEYLAISDLQGPWSIYIRLRAGATAESSCFQLCVDTASNFAWTSKEIVLQIGYGATIEQCGDSESVVLMHGDEKIRPAGKVTIDWHFHGADPGKITETLFYVFDGIVPSTCDLVHPPICF